MEPDTIPSVAIDVTANTVTISGSLDWQFVNSSSGDVPFFARTSTEYVLQFPYEGSPFHPDFEAPDLTVPPFENFGFEQQPGIAGAAIGDLKDAVDVDGANGLTWGFLLASEAAAAGFDRQGIILDDDGDIGSGARVIGLVNAEPLGGSSLDSSQYYTPIVTFSDDWSEMTAVYVRKYDEVPVFNPATSSSDIFTWDNWDGLDSIEGGLDIADLRAALGLDAEEPVEEEPVEEEPVEEEPVEEEPVEEEPVEEEPVEEEPVEEEPVEEEPVEEEPVEEEPVEEEPVEEEPVEEEPVEEEPVEEEPVEEEPVEEEPVEEEPVEEEPVEEEPVEEEPVEEEPVEECPLDQSDATDPLRLKGDRSDDKIAGGSADDLLRGKGGDDTISGNDGDDRIFGQNGRDSIDGGAGEDTVFGGAGADEIDGGDDDDKIAGGGGADEIRGGAGDDTASGGEGDDSLSGEEGEDVLRGKGGDDVIDGGEDDDRLLGGNGVDALVGGDGEDSLFGGNGADYLDGGEGDDYLVGGQASDTFVFRAEWDTDTVKGFNPLRDGLVILDDAESQQDFVAALSEVDGNTVYDLDGDGENVIVFLDRTPEEVALADVSFEAPV